MKSLGVKNLGVESFGGVWFRTVLGPCRMVPASRNSAATEGATKSLLAFSAHPLWESLGRVWNDGGKEGGVECSIKNKKFF